MTTKLSEGFTARQEEALTNSTHFINLWTGAVSAGKTWAWLWDILFEVEAYDGDGELVIFAKNTNTAWRNVFKPMMEEDIFAPFSSKISYRQGAPSATIFGKEVHVVGANDEGSASKIQGATIARAWGDEVTLWPKSFWDMLVTRLRVEGARFLGTCNPGPKSHYLRTEWMLKPETGTHVEHFLIDDNTFLPKSYVAQMKRSFTGVFYRRFILGEWVSAEGAIYEMFDDEAHVVPFEELPAMQHVLGLGVDYGTTNATAGILLGIGVDNRLYALDEWAPGKLTNAALSKDLRDRLEGWEKYGWVPEWIFVDPAAASFSHQLWVDGFPNVAKAQNDVLDGISTVASLLDNGNLFISSRCKNLIAELPAYRWDDKASQRGVDKPVKEDDHYSDGLRYVVFSSRHSWEFYIQSLGVAA